MDPDWTRWDPDGTNRCPRSCASRLCGQVDGRQKLELASSLTGAVSVKEALDFEVLDPANAYYILNVSVGDRNGMTSMGTVRINIIDADDQPPEFLYPNCPSPCFTYYMAAIRDTFQGAITWLTPAPIEARDLDTLNSSITYNIKQGEPKNYAEYVTIDAGLGVPIVIQPVADSDISEFVLIVEAVEDTPLQHSQQTTLWLRVIGRNSTEPTLPPLVVTKTVGGSDSAFRVATIVLGILFGLVLILIVIFVICTTSSKVRTNPVLAKAIGKLHSVDDPPKTATPQAGDTKRKSRKSVTLAKTAGESKMNFMRSLSRSHISPPALTSYSSIEDRDPEVEHLPVSREIDFDHNEMEETDRSPPQTPRISTISDSGVMPYGERASLVGNSEEVGEERTGLSNPVYESERDANSVDGDVVPMAEAPVYI